MALEEPPGQQPRGVFNPHVVDLISLDDGSGEVVLLMLEERRWDGGETQLREVEAKFNAYLEYVLGGHMLKQYPDYEGKPVRFQLHCVENPPAEHRNFFTAMSNFASAEGIRVVVSVVQPTTS
jgi:hypothetical protein